MSETPHLPSDIWRHYVRTIEALRLVELALHDPVLAQVPVDSPFFGVTPSELPDLLKEMSQEADRESSLAMMASFEAVLRLDYLARGQGSAQRSAVIDGRIPRLWSEHAERLPLELLLNAWRDAASADPNVVGRFKQLVNFRDWLAHGRYWAPKGFAGFDIDTVVRVTAAMEREIPTFPKLIDW